MNLAIFPRRRYTEGETPIEYLPNFTKAIGGPDIYIKRDDLLGLTSGGNKTRKLEFLVADALAKGADTLITCGAVQSNHCRLTLAAAVKEGLKCRLVLEERVAGSYRLDASGNNFLFRLLGVEKVTVVPGGSNMPDAMSQVAEELAKEGRRGYVIPGGGSNPIGATGYVACAQEIQNQLFTKGIDIDRLVTPTGSTGTQAGLVVGFCGCNMNIPIVGIGVSRDKEVQEELVFDLAERCAEHVGVKGGIPRAGGHLLRRLLAAEILGAEPQDGRGGEPAGQERGHPARPGLHGQSHGRDDRPQPQRLLQEGRAGPVPSHRGVSRALRLHESDPRRGKRRRVGIANMRQKTVGIIGGMGPEATVDLMQRVIQATPTNDDQLNLRGLNMKKMASVCTIFLVLLLMAESSLADEALIISQNTEASTLHPLAMRMAPEQSIASNIYDSLVDRDPSGKLVPGLATILGTA